MKSSSSSSSSGIGFSGLLQILFIGLKLTNHISWPWWQVMLPTIIGLGIVAVFLLIVLIFVIWEAIKK